MPNNEASYCIIKHLETEGSIGKTRKILLKYDLTGASCTCDAVQIALLFARMLSLSGSKNKMQIYSGAGDISVNCRILLITCALFNKLCQVNTTR